MIENFIPAQGKEVGYLPGKRVPSYGLSSCGYDVRLQPVFRLFTRPNDGRVIDVLDFSEEEITDVVEADTVVLPPGGFLLAVTVEKFNMPKHIAATCVGKSTWARCGAIVNVTPLEPGWSGELVIEITNGTNLPLKIYSGVGIAQLVFHELSSIPSVTYADRSGKYQKQEGITSAKN